MEAHIDMVATDELDALALLNNYSYDVIFLPDIVGEAVILYLCKKYSYDSLICIRDEYQTLESFKALRKSGYIVVTVKEMVTKLEAQKINATIRELYV